MNMMSPDEIKAARQELGLTQRAMAEALALSNGDSATVRSWENGRRNPSGPVCTAIRLMLLLQSSGIAIPGVDVPA